MALHSLELHPRIIQFNEVTCSRQAQNIERLAECHYRLGEFAELSALRKLLPDRSPHLLQLATRYIKSRFT